MSADAQNPVRVAIVSPEGRLDSATSPAFEAEVLERLQAGSNQLVIDLRAVNYISSAGLRVILMAGKKLSATEGKLVLCGLRQEVRAVFEMSGFLDLFAVTDTPEQALEQF